MNTCYLYRHVRLDKNEPFYIGIGKKNKSKHFQNFKTEFCRAFSKHNRNNYWYNIISKTEYKVDIILESNDYEFIKQKEKEFIKLYGRKALEEGTLCNLTDGGEGRVNYKTSEKTKNLISIANSGVNNGMYNKEGARKGVKLSKKWKKEQSKRLKKAHKEGKFPDYKRGNHPQAKPVRHIKSGKEFECVKDAADYFDRTLSGISQHCLNQLKSKDFEFID